MIKLFGFCVLACLLLQSCVMPGRTPPPALIEDEIVVHKLALHKTEQPLEGVGEVSDIWIDQKSKKLVVAGDVGAATGPLDGASPAFHVDAKFPPHQTTQMSIVPAGNECHFLSRGSWGRPGFLADARGKKLWTESQESGVNDTAFGAIGKPAKTMFVVGYNGGGGVSLLDAGGAKLWNQPDGNVWHVEVMQEKSAPAKIIHSNAGGVITVRDESGNIVNRSKAPFYFDHFSLCEYPKHSGKQFLVSSTDGYLWLLRTDGSTEKKLVAPIDERFNLARTIPISFGGNHVDCLATVVSWSLWKRSVLYVHSSTGELIYQEIFPAEYPSLAALAGAGASETLMVGGRNKMVRYHL